jgi:hypothetical protein
MATRPKTGGRQKGTPNRATATVREVISQQWADYYHSGLFDQDLKALTPHDRALLMEKYASYIAPKMQATAIDLAATSSVGDPLLQRLQRLCDDTSDTPSSPA